MPNARYLRAEIVLDHEVITLDTAPISVSVVKTRGAYSDSCQLTLLNLSSATLQRILSRIPFPEYVRKYTCALRVFAGTSSDEMHLLYEGDITGGTVSSPPDITLTLQAKSMYWRRLTWSSMSMPALISLRTLCERVAYNNGLLLEYNIQDKMLVSTSLQGTLQDQLRQIELLAGVSIYAGDGKLSVGVAPVGVRRARLISESTSLISNPRQEPSGIVVVLHYTTPVPVGSYLKVESARSTHLNGYYYAEQVTYSMSTYLQEWQTTVKGVRHDTAGLI